MKRNLGNKNVKLKILQLTKRQKVCLVSAAKGKTSIETAQILGVKVSTIESHRKEIKKKLACATIAQAVYEGIRLGHINCDKDESYETDLK